MGETPGSDDRAWARSLPARAAREVIVCGALAACMDAYCRRTVTGTAHLDALDGPVIFVANHASHMDTPLLLRSLPARWRRRTAVVAAADYFYAQRRLADTVALAFGTVPLERDGGTLNDGPPEHLTRLIADRWSLVVYAEGTRSVDGTVGRLRAGAAVIAAQYGIPIVPVHISGTHEAMPKGRHWVSRQPGTPVGPRRPIGVTFGPPILPGSESGLRMVMERVRLFLEESGATTTPDPRLAARARRAGAA